MRHRRRIVHVMGVALALAAAPMTATAQPGQNLAKQHVQAMTKKARELYAEGVAAFGQKRWADARAAFVGAWALHPHFTIAGNLGAAELKLGLYRDAAEHLALYAREIVKDAEATEKERLEAAAMLAEARAKVGALVVRAEVAGAEVFVDGARIGATPFVDPIFVEPGEHTVEVRAEGFRAGRATVQIAAGGQQEVAPALVKIAEASAPVRAGGGNDVARSAPAQRPPVVEAPAPRLWPIAVGGAAAAVVLGVGVGLTIAANGESDEAARLGDQVGPDWGCRAPAQALAGLCQDLGSAIDARDGLSNAAMGMFIAGGVVAVGTAAYAVWALTRPRAPRDAALRVVPVGGAHGGGIAVRGAW